MDAQLHRGERRRRPSPSSAEEYLRGLPGSVLLDRLPVPMLATGLDGIVVYTNPAFATMLGHHPDTVMLTGHPLPALLPDIQRPRHVIVSPNCALPAT